MVEGYPKTKGCGRSQGLGQASSYIEGLPCKAAAGLSNFPAVEGDGTLAQRRSEFDEARAEEGRSLGI